MADAPPNVRDEFRNTTDGWIGVVQFVGPHREPKGTAVEPHGTVWLNEEEQILTANAPKNDEDNPFVERTVKGEADEPDQTLPPVLELVTKGVEIRSRRPYGAQSVPVVKARDEVVDEPKVEEETGGAPAPEGEPVEGTRAPGEEVGTPAAKPEGRRRRKVAA